MIKLDLKRDTPIYEQIIEQVKFHVVKGNIKPGMPIPSVRKLALELSITPGTVAKAYQELERDGIIYSVGGKGSFISSNAEAKNIQLEQVKMKLYQAASEAKNSGIDCHTAVQITESAYSKEEQTQ